MSWFTKMIGVDKEVQKQIQTLLTGTAIPSSVANPQLLEYRMNEYRAWASSNPNSLLTFYKTAAEPTTHADRLMFWKWVGGRNVPKVHYPAPEILLSHIKGILFSGELEIEATKETSEQELEEFNKRLQEALKDINMDDFTANGSLFETYSGSVASRFVMDSDVHDKPIIQQYPRERFTVKSKYGKTQEITFIDEYYVGDKVYRLESYYGKGYIRYALFYNNKQVSLDTIEDTSGLQDITFNPKVILATWKKNRTVSNEFPELVYGGSDFEGITDIFHSIDEIFSSLVLYIRRSRPVLTVTEDLLPSSDDGKRRITPKEFEFDIIKLKASDIASDRESKLYRDNPEIKTQAFMDSIKDLMLSVYQKVAISYASVNDSGIGANASGDSIAKREKSTTIMRDSKIKLWIPYIQENLRLYLMCEDIMNGVFDSTNFTFTEEYKEWEFKVMFSEYNGQTFSEKVADLKLAKDAGLIDTEYGINELHGKDLTDEEKKELTRRAKIEAGATLFESEVE